MKKMLFLSALLLLFYSGFAQIIEPVKWSYETKALDESRAEIIIKAKIDEGWNLYAQEVPAGGPLPTQIKFTPATEYKTQGKTISSPNPTVVYDEMFEMNIGKWKKHVSFKQIIHVLQKKSFTINVDIDYMVCNDKSCIPLSENLKIKIDGTKFTTTDVKEQPDTNTKAEVKDATPLKKDTLKADSLVAKIETKDSESGQKTKSIWLIFLIGLGAGFLALLTPCVWPVIPMTVNFFLNKTQTRSSAIRDTLFYGLTIVVVYVTLGLAISLIFGPDALGKLATSPGFNLFFFALMILFAISFFGVFELRLPSKWTSALDKKSEKSGLIGVFFMGVTLVLVSFSCTGPILGALLVEAASSANFLSPLMGMLGFSIAMAIPFMLLSVFPSWLKSMPKSGGWMNSVKVVLAFLMLAFSLKFFVVADSVAGWNILSRELFIAIWVVVFMLMGLYLLGKIKMPHDSDLKHVGVFRLFLAGTSFVIAVLLIPGLWGAPLNSISGFMPSITTQSFNLAAGGTSDKTVQTDMAIYQGYKTKAGAHGLVYFSDFKEGVNFAIKQKKPVLLYFSGHGCTNCKKMEATVWGDQKILPVLQKEFVIVTLYTDDRVDLPDSMKYVSTVTGKEREIKTYGQKWSDMQAAYFGVNAQPYYVLLNPFIEIKDKNSASQAMLAPPSAYETNIDIYLAFLQKGIDEFKRYNNKN